MRSYKYDVFLSYAHVDNEKSLSEQEGWITAFQGALDLRCHQSLGRPARTWRDTLLTVNDKETEDQLRKVIRQALAECAVILIVMSPIFSTRDWFEREYRYFVDAAERIDGVFLGDTSRIFVVYIGETDRETLPEYLQNITGWNFYSESGNAIPKDHPSYSERLENIVRSLVHILQKMEADAS